MFVLPFFGGPFLRLAPGVLSFKVLPFSFRGLALVRRAQQLSHRGSRRDPGQRLQVEENSQDAVGGAAK